MTKLKPSFKIFLVVLLAGALFGGYYAFMPKKCTARHIITILKTLHNIM